MDIFQDMNELSPERCGRPAATLGFFDGLHLGHRRVLERLLQRAQALAAPALVITFENHPAAVLLGEAPPLITSLPHRLRLFDEAGLDQALVLRFDPELAARSAEEFARSVLRDKVGARAMVLGFDASFGQGGRGNAALLASMSGELGFETESVGPVEAAGRVVSSTALREAIAAGELEAARAMLGRPVEVLGTVVRGDQRGRTIGFPTANLDLHHAVRPPRGVYAGAAELRGPDGRIGKRLALINIGRRPTFHPEQNVDLVEVHLVDFEGDCYGAELRVKFHAKLREEQTFPSAADLAEQIAKDRDAAQALLASGDISLLQGPGGDRRGK